MLNFIQRLWDFINKLDTKVKTFIIVVLLVYIGYDYFIKLNLIQLINYFESKERLKIEDEKYTLKMATYINKQVKSLLLSDPDCFNVLLLNYHNSQESLLGFRYLYLNCLAESPKGIYDEPLKEYWKDLEYVYYEDELSRIRNAGFFRIEDVDSIKYTFPKFYSRLKICLAKAAAFYPIEGIDYPIGMVIVLYKQPKLYSLGFYNTKIAPYIQKLSSILDYRNVTLKLK